MVAERKLAGVCYICGEDNPIGWKRGAVGQWSSWVESGTRLKMKYKENTCEECCSDIIFGHKSNLSDIIEYMKDNGLADEINE